MKQSICIKRELTRYTAAIQALEQAQRALKKGQSVKAASLAEKPVRLLDGEASPRYKVVATLCNGRTKTSIYAGANAFRHVLSINLWKGNIYAQTPLGWQLIKAAHN